MMPLVGIPAGEDLAVIAGNWGGATAPAWSHNLDANPECTVSWKGTTVEVKARRAADDEAEQIFEAGGAMHPGYPKYRTRAAHRDFKIYVLDSAG